MRLHDHFGTDIAGRTRKAYAMLGQLPTQNTYLAMCTTTAAAAGDDDAAAPPAAATAVY